MVSTSIYLYSTYILLLINNRLSLGGGGGGGQDRGNPDENGLERGQDKRNPEENGLYGIHTCNSDEQTGWGVRTSVTDRDPGSGIWCLFDPLDPGSGMGKKSGSGSGIRVRGEQPGSYFRVLKKKIKSDVHRSTGKIGFRTGAGTQKIGRVG